MDFHIEAEKGPVHCVVRLVESIGYHSVAIVGGSELLYFALFGNSSHDAEAVTRSKSDLAVSTLRRKQEGGELEQAASPLYNDFFKLSCEER